MEHLIYWAVQEDKPDKRRSGLDNILGGRPIIYIFSCQLLIPSWSQCSATVFSKASRMRCHWCFYKSRSQQHGSKQRSGNRNGDWCEWLSHSSFNSHYMGSQISLLLLSGKLKTILWRRRVIIVLSSCQKEERTVQSPLNLHKSTHNSSHFWMKCHTGGLN